MYNDTLILIPSLDPDEKLLELIQRLKDHKFENIMIVNDGSSAKYDHFFEQAKELQCIVLKHAINLGKGRALKTSYNEILNTYPNIKYIVTVDSDGQHSPVDTIAVLEKLREYPDALVLGCRDFNSSNVPFKSQFGNKLTRYIMRVLCGVKVSDTQTGLRGFPRELLPKMLEIAGERFEYETNVLLATNTFSIPIQEVSIQTIYYNDNKSTHFHPIRDSLKIYASLTKFILSAITSFMLDIGIFNIMMPVFQTMTHQYLLFASIVARMCSSLYNYFINKKIVFKKDKKQTGYSFLRYYAVVFIVMFCSAFSVQFLFNLTNWNPTLLKIGVDLVLFCANFMIQRTWVFK